MQGFFMRCRLLFLPRLKTREEKEPDAQRRMTPTYVQRLRILLYLRGEVDRQSQAFDDP